MGVHARNVFQFALFEKEATEEFQALLQAFMK